MNIYRETARLILGSRATKNGESDSPKHQKSKIVNHIETKVPSFTSDTPRTTFRSSTTASENSLTTSSSNEIHPHAALTSHPSRAIGLPHLTINTPTHSIHHSTHMSRSPTSAHVDFKTIRNQAKQKIYSYGIKNHFLPSTIDQYRVLFNKLRPNHDGMVNRGKLQLNFDSAKFYETISIQQYEILTNFIGTKGEEPSPFDSIMEVSFEDFFQKLCELGLKGDGSVESNSLKLKEFINSLKLFVEKFHDIPMEKEDVIEEYDIKLHRLISTRYLPTTKQNNELLNNNYENF